ncbi:hypothetical protein LZ30DRAFT_187955 [Colletotrichum cereale]|nr:hypothetical protein LZ30DRAFT_187955 [Colletotrichum cereale]
MCMRAACRCASPPRLAFFLIGVLSADGLCQPLDQGMNRRSRKSEGDGGKHDARSNVPGSLSNNADRSAGFGSPAVSRTCLDCKAEQPMGLDLCWLESRTKSRKTTPQTLP